MPLTVVKQGEVTSLSHITQSIEVSLMRCKTEVNDAEVAIREDVRLAFLKCERSWNELYSRIVDSNKGAS